MVVIVSGFTVQEIGKVDLEELEALVAGGSGGIPGGFGGKAGIGPGYTGVSED